MRGQAGMQIMPDRFPYAFEKSDSILRIEQGFGNEMRILLLLAHALRFLQSSCQFGCTWSGHRLWDPVWPNGREYNSSPGGATRSGALQKWIARIHGAELVHVAKIPEACQRLLRVPIGADLEAVEATTAHQEQLVA